MVKDHKTLFFSGYLLPERGFGYLSVSIVSLISAVIAAGRFFVKNKAKLNGSTIYDFLYFIGSCFVLLVFLIIAVGTIKDAKEYELASEKLILSDGNVVLINEFQEFPDYTEIKVYKINGIIAKEIYAFRESSYFSDLCIKENKWDYSYSETDKKLTLILRYDKPKNEDASRVWNEFVYIA